MEDFSSYLSLRNNRSPDDELLTKTSLGKVLDSIPLARVDKKDLLELTQALNLKQLIPTSKGYPRDYRGLAELMGGISAIEVETQIKHSHNPTGILIEKFAAKDGINGRNPSINDLLKLIESIERFDVIDDFLPTLLRLASAHKLYAGQMRQSYHEVIHNDNTQVSKQMKSGESSHTRKTYDAFLSFAPEDNLYAQKIINLLYKNGRSIVTASHVCPGQFEHDGLIELIERCRKVVVILTPNFTRSKECAFQANVASEVSIKTATHMIIPVLCEVCEEASIPSKIRMLSKIDLTNHESREWQLTKLIPALGCRETNDHAFIHDARLLISGGSSMELTVDSSANNQQETADVTHSKYDCKPIVEPFYSQPSSAIGDISQACNMLTIEEGSSPISSSMNPLNIKWFKKFFRVANSNLSQVNLITTEAQSDERSNKSDNSN